jgi:HK97 family phage major capsid protein/HK97 family phage prohead protease
MSTKRDIPNKLPIQYRSFEIDRKAVDAEKRTLKLSFSSEYPVDRWFGQEVLDHDPKSVRMDRLKNGAPLLFNHDRDALIGVIEDAEVEGKRGSADARVGSTTYADEKFALIQDGILRHVSVGYRVHKMVLEKTDDKEGDTYRITDWEPVEISLVTVPADPSVGIGRSAPEEFPVYVDRSISASADAQENKKMSDTKPEATVDVKEVREQERKRVSEITALGKHFSVADDKVQKWVAEGTSEADVRKAILDEKIATAQANAVRTAPADIIGMSAQEKRRYSIARAILVAGGLKKGDPVDGGLELEVSEALRKQFNIPGSGAAFLVPTRLYGYDGQRVMTKGTTTAGGHTVETELRDLIEFIDKKARVIQLGATVLRGLQGNVDFPRQDSRGTAAWKAESAAASASDSSFDKVSLSPKRLTAKSSYTVELLRQSSIDVEGFVRGDLGKRIALALDLAGINGSGSAPEPRGILNTTGIGDVAISTNGGAPTYAHIVDLETEIFADDADVDGLKYLTTAVMRGKLKKTEQFATTNGQPVWTGGAEGNMNGYSAYASNQVPSALVKGTSSDCHAIIFGNFPELLIGEWGVVELIVDPYTRAGEGEYVVNARGLFDLAIRHAQSFAAIKDARNV